jgi:hypothetical protein
LLRELRFFFCLLGEGGGEGHVYKRQECSIPASMCHYLCQLFSHILILLFDIIKFKAQFLDGLLRLQQFL